MWIYGHCIAEGLSCKETEHRCEYMVNVLLKCCHARKPSVSVNMVNVLLKDCHAKKHSISMDMG